MNKIRPSTEFYDLFKIMIELGVIVSLIYCHPKIFSVFQALAGPFRRFSTHSHSFVVVFSLISNATSFFIHPLNRFVLKKNVYALLVFLNRVPCIQLSRMIPGVNIVGRKVSVASINRVGEERGGGSGGSLRPQWGP